MKIKSITKDHQYQPCDTPFERQTNVIPSKMQHLAVQACWNGMWQHGLTHQSQRLWIDRTEWDVLNCRWISSNFLFSSFFFSQTFVSFWHIFTSFFSFQKAIFCFREFLLLFKWICVKWTTICCRFLFVLRNFYATHFNSVLRWYSLNTLRWFS